MITKILKKGKNSTISSLFAGIVVIMAMFMVVSCEKSETEIANQQQTVRKPQPISEMEVMQYLPEVVDGRLVFKDEESFEKYQQWVFDNQGNPEKINEINRHLGFVSFKEVYKNGLKLLENNPTEAKAYILSHSNVFEEVEYDSSTFYDLSIPNTLSYIADQYGIYQIGERIFKASLDYCYSANIIDGENSIIEKLRVVTGPWDSDNSVVSESTNPEKLGATYNTVYFDNTHRLVIRLLPGYYNGKYYIKAVTHSQQKIGVWIGKALQGVYVSKSSGYYYPLGSNTQYTISMDFDSASQEASLDIYFNSTQADPSRSQCSTSHYGEYDDEYVYFTHSNVFYVYN